MDMLLATGQWFSSPVGEERQSICEERNKPYVPKAPSGLGSELLRNVAS